MVRIEDRQALSGMDGVTKTGEGYLDAVAPRVARTGIQIYRASEIGMVGDAAVRVFRDESDVFNFEALESFDGIPVTLGHPPELVDASNVEKYGVGHARQDVLRDGQHLRIGLRVESQRAVDAVEKLGVRDLSVGYTCLIDATPGTTPDGQPYDARQTNIRANHIAIVPKGRAGSARIGDARPWGAAPLDQAEKETAMADNLQTVVAFDKAFQVNDDGARLHEVMQTALDAAEAEKATLGDKVAGLEAKDTASAEKIADLEAKLADAEITPQKLADAAKSRQATIDGATAMGLDAKDMDEMSEEEIKKASVKKKMGDTAKDYTADQIATAFATLSAVTVSTKDSLAGGLETPKLETLGTAYSARNQRLGDAWKTSKEAS